MICRHIGGWTRSSNAELFCSLLIEGGPPLVVHQQIAVWIVKLATIYVLIADMFMDAPVAMGLSYTGMFMMVL